MLPDDGYEIIEGVLDDAAVEVLQNAVGAMAHRQRGGTRNLLQECPAVAEFAAASSFRKLADEALGTTSFPVKATLFDKTEHANWKVAWHQDTAIAVAERLDVAGYSGWTVKDGVQHVHAPADVLEQIIALRLHLDNCDSRNGALRVIPGSHRAGKLSREAIQNWRARVPEETCAVSRGGVLSMRPLLLHTSSAAANPGHRRVIHIEYACRPLPYGLRWHAEIHDFQITKKPNL